MNDQLYKCSNVNCTAKYINRQHLSRHKKTCKHPAPVPTVRSAMEPVFDESSNIYIAVLLKKECPFSSKYKANVKGHLEV